MVQNTGVGNLWKLRRALPPFCLMSESFTNIARLPRKSFLLVCIEKVRQVSSNAEPSGLPRVWKKSPQHFTFYFKKPGEGNFAKEEDIQASYFTSLSIGIGDHYYPQVPLLYSPVLNTF